LQKKKDNLLSEISEEETDAVSVMASERKQAAEAAAGMLLKQQQL